MAKEIERKFLVESEDFKKESVESVLCRQGYLNSAKERTVRVRVMGGRAFLTVKGASAGAVRVEYEYEIPLAEGQAMLDALAEKPVIEKKRYKVPFGGFVWEVDEFSGENRGLVVAEIELASEDQEFGKPVWAGEEVTGDSRYFNSSLLKYPFSKW